MIEFRLDARSGVPTYLQLVQQVKQALRLGILHPGDQLPTVKEVVASLAINPNTVLKAYRELDLEGLDRGAPRAGDVRLQHAAAARSPTASMRCARRSAAGSRAPARPGFDERRPWRRCSRDTVRPPASMRVA